MCPEDIGKTPDGKGISDFKKYKFYCDSLVSTCHNFDFHDKNAEDFSVFPFRHKRVPTVSRNMWKWLLYQHPWILQMSL